MSTERFVDEIIKSAVFVVATHNAYTGSFLGKGHKHADLYQISYVVKGQTRVMLGNRHYAVNGGELLTIPPCCRHASGPGEENKRFDLLQIKFKLNRRLPLPFPGFVCMGYPAELLDVFHSIVNEFHMQRRQRETMLRLELARLIVLVLRRNVSNKSRHLLSLPVDRLRMEQCVAKVMRHIQLNYSRRLTLPAMAKMNGYSVSRLSHTFTQSAGISPVRYLIKYRLSKALDLMGNTGKKLEDIALETGFSSVHYFSRLFHKRYHQSPRRYARLIYNARTK